MGPLLCLRIHSQKRKKHREERTPFSFLLFFFGGGSEFERKYQCSAHTSYNKQQTEMQGGALTIFSGGIECKRKYPYSANIASQ